VVVTLTLPISTEYNKGPRVTKPISNERNCESLDVSTCIYTKHPAVLHSLADSAAFCTSPPSIPQSALYETQDAVPSPRTSQRPKQKTLTARKTTPALDKSQDPATRPSQHHPSTRNPTPTPHRSQTPTPMPHKTPGPTSSSRGIPSTAQNPGESGEYTVPPLYMYGQRSHRFEDAATKGPSQASSTSAIDDKHL
jgi:hypothetical protein